jgi:hypothetical protein
MQEMFQGIEKFKKEEQAKKSDVNTQIQKIIAEINQIKSQPMVVASAPAGSVGVPV